MVEKTSLASSREARKVVVDMDPLYHKLKWFAFQWKIAERGTNRRPGLLPAFVFVRRGSPR
jgi:hypothetical protein